MPNPERNESAMQAAAIGAANMANTAGAWGDGGAAAGAGKGFQSGAGKLPAVLLPTGGGAVRGLGEKFSVNAASGTCLFSVPLPFSPGRAGFTPGLELKYDSGGGNGCLGFGWSLGIGAITRKSDKGLPRYEDGDESDVYLLGGAEDLVPLLDAAGARTRLARTVFGVDWTVTLYRPRVEGAFARIERWSALEGGRSFWRTISGDNVTTLFGYDAGASVADPNFPDHVYSWHVCRSWDDKGNAVVYRYVPEDGRGVNTAVAAERNRTAGARGTQIYLKAVEYGNVVPYGMDWSGAEEAALPGDWKFKVVLDFGDHQAVPPGSAPDADWAVQPDAYSSYRAGFEMRSYRRVRRVLFFNNFADEPTCGADRLVRSVDLTYRDEQAPGDPRNPIYSKLTAIAVTGYGAAGAARTMPPITLTYSEPAMNGDVLTLDPDSRGNLPEGLGGMANWWVDLDGEGLPGLLSDAGGAWYYKRNRSANNLVQMDTTVAVRARLGGLETVISLPVRSRLGDVQLVDLSGDGQLDLVAFEESDPGYFKRTADGGWEPFQSFAALPEVDWKNGNLRFVDLTGDGRADVLMTEDGLFTLYASLGEEGFEPAATVRTPWDEEKGPKLVFDDGTDTIFLADMSGDGLNDIVRVRNGEVCYWPNLGYAHFGAKVTMDGAPRFAGQDSFDPRRLRLADIDGSGMSDLLYVGADGVHAWFNQSGNGWSAGTLLAVFPSADVLSKVQVVDLLGTGTACVVWSSALSGETAALRYVDLMGGQKPHLLVNVQNNLGAETRVTYAPSTRYYRDDADAGTPWVTRLPFPVQVIERVETFDWVGRNRAVSRYAYHHGYFDGYEREFRGFGRVEQWDTEEFREDIDFADGEFSNWTAASWAPPVRTVSWFHTGAFVEAGAVSRQFAGEYWGEAGLGDSALPAGLDAFSLQEAYRALKSHPLRTEVYAEDKTGLAGTPYSVTEQNFAVVCLQPIGVNLHGVFRVDARETLTAEYERVAADPRVSHAMTLECDEYGNALRQVSVGYGRRPGYAPPEPGLAPAVQAALAYDQGRVHVRATARRFTNALDNPAGLTDVHRLPGAWATDVADFAGVLPTGPMFEFAEMDGLWTSLWPGGSDVPYEQVWAADITGVETPGTVPTRRMLAQERLAYRSDDLTGLLGPGVIEELALPGQGYKVLLTQGLVEAVFGARVSADLTACGYVELAGETGWWMPSGLAYYSAGVGDSAAVELDAARAGFFLQRRVVDPFGGTQSVDYDGYALLTVRCTDPVGNQTAAANDYRVLAPAMVTDANGNRGAVAFDALGMVTATAAMGKSTETLGDELSGFIVDLDDAAVAAEMDDPLGAPAALLGNATTRVVCDLGAYVRSVGTGSPAPVGVYSLARETHVAAMGAGESTDFQYRVAYGDGLGRTIQTKALCAPGPLVEGGAEATVRWVASGWTILNNKGKPVRQYEPFFTATSAFEFAVQAGVSSVLLYDAAGRGVGALHPDSTWNKVVYGAWRQENWDANDTVMASPLTDGDLGVFATAALGPGVVWSSWHDLRIGGTFGASAEERAAQYDTAKKAEACAGTCMVAYRDSLGRSCLAVSDNGGGTRYAARTALDTEGKPLAVFDALGRLTERYCLDGAAAGTYVAGIDMAGRPLYSANADAGERRQLPDALGAVIQSWDERRNAFRMVYDAARRKTHRYASTAGEAERLLDLAVYGEGMASQNLCGRVFRQYDGSGYVEHGAYDFKGNLLTATRQLTADYHGPADWMALDGVSGAAALDAAAVAAGLVPEGDGGRDRYTSASTFDALNRAVQTVLPHSAAMKPGVLQVEFDRAGQVTQLDLWLGQAAAPAGLLDGGTADRHVLVSSDYNARGQRLAAAFGNGTVSSFAYDAATFRLTQLTTTRPGSFGAAAQTLQLLEYFYDAVGNVTTIRDDADIQDVVFFRNQRVEPSTAYTYDPLYRLISATGREHLGQNGTQIATPQQVTDDDSFRMMPSQPGDGNAMGIYTETYQYDAANNLLAMMHQTSSGNWARGYLYAEPSQLAAAEFGNRLTGTTLPGDAGTGSYSARYSYDAHGNMTSMPHLPQMTWDADNRLLSTTSQVVKNGTPGTTFYTYDNGGQRVRKATDAAAATGVQAKRTKERIYLGAVEVYREFAADGTTVTLERETLHASAGGPPLVAVETRTLGTDAGPAQQVRYQHGNHLGSAVLELGDSCDVLSYEEYFPFGSTSYQSVAAQTDVPKRYRFTGKERDDENGLNYHGGRYYAPWLGRWVSCDPVGIKGGANLYAYAANNPIGLSDPSGHAPQAPQVPTLGGLWEYGKKMAEGVRGALGRNVQGDHPIQVNLRELQRTAADGTKYYDRAISSAKKELTVLVETGKGLFHTELGKVQKQIVADVKAGVIQHESDLVGATQDAYDSVGRLTNSPVNPSIRDEAILSNQNTLHRTSEETAAELARAPAAPTTMTEASLDATFHDASQAAKEVEEVATAAKSTEEVAQVAKVTEEVGTVAKVLSTAGKGARLLKPLAPIVRGAGKVLAPLAIIASGVELATAKTSEQRVDAGLGLASGVAFEFGPLGAAAGGGIMIGQGVEHTLHVSDFSSGAGVAAKGFLERHGISEDTAFAAGAVVTVGVTGPAIVYAATAKVMSWLH